ELGIADSTAAPPLWKLFWRTGWAVPPPPFVVLGQVTPLTGGFFGIFWGLLTWLFLWSQQGMPVWSAVAASVLARALFGICMALYFRRLARKHGLSAWTGSQP